LRRKAFTAENAEHAEKRRFNHGEGLVVAASAAEVAAGMPG